MQISLEAIAQEGYLFPIHLSHDSLHTLTMAAVSSRIKVLDGGMVRRCNEAWIYRADTDRRERRSSSSAQTCRPLCGDATCSRPTPR